MQKLKFYIPGFLLSAMLLLSVTAQPLPADNSNDLVLLAQQSECSRQIGPFVTQNTAWRELQEAKSQGYAVSGVFPCYDGYGTRGYCFNVFFPC